MDAVETATLTGTVRSYNGEKGYGFIRREDHEGERDIFVHVTGIIGRQPLTVGQRVTYRIGADRERRPCAVDVAPLPET